MRALLAWSSVLIPLLTLSCGFVERLSDEPYYPPPTEFKTHIAASYANAKIQKLAVLIENKTDKDYDPHIQTAIEGYLLSEKGYQVVTRSRLDQILAEQGSAVQDFTEEPGRLGAILNAQALIFVELGTCSGVWLYLHESQYPRCDVNATMVSVETGETLFTSMGVVWGYWGWESAERYQLEILPKVLEDLPRAYTPGSGAVTGQWKGRAYGPNGEAALMTFDLRARAPNGDRIIRMTFIENPDAAPVDAGYFWGFAGSDGSSGAWPEDRDEWLQFRASNPGKPLSEAETCTAVLKRRSPILYEGDCWGSQGTTHFEMEEP